MRIVLFTFFILTYTTSIAQEFKTDGSYKYMFANKWDKAIQTYNFSRPFIENKQPLFIHGVNVSMSYIFKSSKKFKHGINVSYAYFKSSAKNENLNNTLNLHFLNLGYIIHYETTEKMKGLYTDVIISATTSGLYRNVNGKRYEFDNKKSKAFGIGGELSIKTGYNFKLKNKIPLSPFVLVGYTPYLYSPNSEALINQTKELVSKKYTSILCGQIGCSFTISNKKE